MKNHVERIWAEQVYNRYVYRGMDKADLIFPLDPIKRPFNQYKPIILGFFDLLDEVLAAGHHFEILEEHFGNKYYHNPKNLSQWSRRDLERVGIDFTSIYQNAREYSDCWQGSQLKQNMKSISNYLLSMKTDALIKPILKNGKFEQLLELSSWLNMPRASKPIVIHLRRDLDIFESTSQMLPLGSKDLFCSNLINRIGSDSKLEFEDILKLLPNETSEFYCSICKPIEEIDIAKIEEF